MNSRSRFIFVDVFGLQKYSGNQLAVFFDGSAFSDLEMQQIARETNFSETTFIMSDAPQNDGYPVRIFTPGGEVNFAGHPTLGTAYVIREHIICRPVSRVTLNLKVGAVPVDFPTGGAGGDILWMRQVEPTFGDPLSADLMLQVLGLSAEALDPHWPIMPVSTGLPFTIVPLRTMDALKRARVNGEWFERFAEGTWAKGILAFCPGGYESGQDFGVRVFVPHLGVPEDPATGSGNGCLAGYLIKNRYAGLTKVDVRTGQGYEIGRPSQLHLRAWEENGHIRIEVGGKVIPVAEGVWG